MLYAQKKSTNCGNSSCSEGLCLRDKSGYSIQYVQKIRNLFVENIKK